jgi:hypothetical protein
MHKAFYLEEEVRWLRLHSARTSSSHGAARSYAQQLSPQ